MVELGMASWVFVKREKASSWVLIFLVAAVVSLLLTRTFLMTFFLIFGYDLTLSTRILHIAHVLWGGMLLMVALIMTLTLNGDKARTTAAMVGGVGFGLFVDEVGKYMTRDNNYLFRPAIMVIYVVFIGIFLIYRYFEKHESKDPKAVLYQTINDLEEIAENDFEEGEKMAMIKKIDYLLLNTSGNTLKLVKCLRITAESMECIANRPKGSIEEGVEKLRNFCYHKIFKRKIVMVGLILVAVVYAIYGLGETIYLFGNENQRELFDVFYRGQDLLTKTDLYMLTLKVLSDGVTSVMFVAGVFWVGAKRRLRGIEFFRLGILVNIFLTTVFRFYFVQFAGVWGLALSIGMYYCLAELEQSVRYKLAKQ